MKLYDLPCKGCGKIMQQVARNRLFCPECAMIRSNIRKAHDYAMKKSTHIIDKPCEDCGEMMYGVTKQKHICPKCKVQRAKMRKLFGVKRQSELDEILQRSARPGHAPKLSSLEETALKADQEGLSYGYYVLKHGLF